MMKMGEDEKKEELMKTRYGIKRKIKTVSEIKIY